jgi:radical SAM superfamily enzyme YgiQ (UPF0313 family)
MKLVFVNIMHELHEFDSTATISQPPVPLGVLNTVTPSGIETALLDEQTEQVRFDGDVFAFSVATQYARKVYDYADELRAAGRTVILGGIHVTVCPDEAARHADAVVTGEAELLWPTICEDLLAGRLEERYDGSPTPPAEMQPVDYRFFAGRPYLTPASLFATRGCPYRCSFCVSSNYMGPFRTKPLDVLEEEIDQLARLYPGAYLQFTDDNLLADRRHAAEVVAMVRRKRQRFVAMVTMRQFCDDALMDEMAASGCLGVAVGVESVDDDNCRAVGKPHNSDQPIRLALQQANRRGMQVCALLMVGLPHDTPERLARARQYLAELPCSLFDFRVLRIYPSSPLYDALRATGEVEEAWWLGNGSVPTNLFLPGHARVYFRHRSLSPMQIQQWTLSLTRDLDRLNTGAVTHVLSIGCRGAAVRFAMLLLTARRRLTRQADRLLAQLEQVMAAQDRSLVPRADTSRPFYQSEPNTR